MNRRQYIELFIIASLMSVEDTAGASAYNMCRDFLLPDMFKDAKNRWVYGIICEMRGKGYAKTCEDDIFQYLCTEKNIPASKMSGICCWLIEVYLHFCNITNPVTGVRWTVGEAVDELIKLSDTDEWETLTK